MNDKNIPIFFSQNFVNITIIMFRVKLFPVISVLRAFPKEIQSFLGFEKCGDASSKAFLIHHSLGKSSTHLSKQMVVA